MFRVRLHNRVGRGVVTANGAVRVDCYMQTGFKGLFAGGDTVPCERNAITAVGHGKRAARAIDAWLAGRVPGPCRRFEFNYDYGKGCGVRATECPCGAIKMVHETI